MTLSIAVQLAGADAGVARLVQAAFPEERSPRRLFNAGLAAEERGDVHEAARSYLGARLAGRQAIADQIYARGAGIRLLRLLAGRDDDAAAAAAFAIADEAAGHGLAPLVRTLLHRIGEDAPLQLRRGMIRSLRIDPATGRVLLELVSDEDETTILSSEGSICPLSVGDRVRLLARKRRGHAQAGWEVVAMGADGADAWMLLRVAGMTAK